MLKTIGDRFVIDPYYEGHDTKIGSIIIPDSMADPLPSQGRVIAAPDQYLYLEQRYVVFHRFRDRAHIGEYVVVTEPDLVCILNDGEIELFHHRNEALILPSWESKYQQPSELIYLPPTALEHHQPVIQGKVIDANEFAPFEEGEIVAMEPGKGSEIAVKSVLYYVVPYEHILGIIHG